ncbi:hypothetical protein SEA_EWALD_32 [Gordonia phage Ewald]|nr:hypothetical protein SEA_EWALD_32 [Gordonia phage Ewald]
MTACSSESEPVATTTVTESAAPSTWSSAAQDQTFLAQVELIDEFSSTSRASKIDMGRNVCVGYEQGKQMGVLQILIEEYNADAAASFMHAATSVYCPEHLR